MPLESEALVGVRGTGARTGATSVVGIAWGCSISADFAVATKGEQFRPSVPFSIMRK